MRSNSFSFLSLFTSPIDKLTIFHSSFRQLSFSFGKGPLHPLPLLNSITVDTAHLSLTFVSPLHTHFKMPATQNYYSSYPQTSYPIQVPQKQGYYYPPQQTYGRVSASPPEAPDSVTTSGVASYEPSAASSNYAGSHSDYESTNGATSVDLLDYMGNRVNGSFDPMPLDRSLAKQAQT
jgi:hypothetical protein